MELERDDLKGLAGFTKKGELQSKIERKNEEIDILKIGLSGIAKRYGYKNVQEFYRAYNKCDYIIVHGCGLKNGESVSPLLKGRVDKAVQIFRKSKESVKIVVSGGQGRDEKISEAQAIKNYLLEIGIAEDSIVTEVD